MSPYTIGSIIKLISINPFDMIIWVNHIKEDENQLVDCSYYKIGTIGIVLELPNKDNLYKILFGNKIGFVSEQCFILAA